MKTKLYIVIIITLSLVWLILSADGNVALAAWEPPIGIPVPSFGIEETHLMYEGQTYDFGSGPEPYKDAGNGPYTHYVDNTHPDATDSGNPYGTASNPRNTIPWDLPAGSVAEVHGGPYNYGIPTVGYRWTWFSGAGTEERPVFIRGTEGEIPVFNRMQIRAGGSYLVIENFDFDDSRIRIRTDLGLMTGDHISIRNLEVYNGPLVLGGNTAIYAGGGSHVVIYNNYVHDNGDSDWPEENDFLGVLADGYYVWVVDNHMHGNGGDSVMVNSGAARYIYIGRNLMHNEGENAVDLKACADVIVSENVMYGFPDTAHSNGDAIRVNDEGVQENIWILYNNISDAVMGIAPYQSDFNPYIIGNIIHGCDTGITSGTRAVVNNVIYNVGTGISYGNNVTNNIIYNASNYHLDRGNDVHHNLLWQDGGPILLNDVTSTDSIEADPQFADAANGDFHLQPTSPAIDNGTLNDVYQTFFDLYGIDIRKDIEGNSRPQGSGWDIGAYEYVASSPSPNQPPIANAGPNQTITDKDKDGSEEVTLDGSASRDPDGTIVNFIWSEGGLEIATGKNPTVTLSTGTHSITLTVADDGGLTDTDTVTIKVLEGDKGFGELPAGCYNNVFNPTKGERALIVVELSKQAHVKLNLYNARGNRIRELADEQKETGRHKYYWYGKDDSGNVVGSGLYFVHIQAGDYKKTKKIVIIK